MPESLHANESLLQEPDRTASSYEMPDEERRPQPGHDGNGQSQRASHNADSATTAMPDVARGRHYRPAQLRDPDQVVNSGIAWFSVALGVTQIVAPDAVARLIGMRPSQTTRSTMRAIGVRGLTTGFGLLSNAKRSPWLWARLAGDMVDLSLLGTGVGRRADDRSRAGRAALAVGSVAALDLLAATRSRRTHRQRVEADGFASVEETVQGPLSYPPSEPRGGGTKKSTGDEQVGVVTSDAIEATESGLRKVRHAVTVNRPASELYAYWRDLKNLPNFMRHLESVTHLEGGRSHWVTRGPGGVKVEWDAEIVADVPGELIAWQSLPGADVRNAGTVRFIPVPAGRGTEVHVELDYSPPAGSLGAVVAKLFRAEPGQQIRDDLKAFKSVMEVGEILHAGAKEKQQVERDYARSMKAEADVAEVRG